MNRKLEPWGGNSVSLGGVDYRLVVVLESNAYYGTDI